MSCLFCAAMEFNQPLDSWDVSNVSESSPPRDVTNSIVVFLLISLKLRVIFLFAHRVRIICMQVNNMFAMFDQAIEFDSDM